MAQTLYDFLSQLHPFSQEELKDITSYFTTRNVPASTQLVSLEQVSREVYFIIKGCMRYYYITDEGSDITGFIYEEGMFAGTIESFFMQTPSNQLLETVEECELLVLEYVALQELLENQPIMYKVLMQIFAQRMVFAQRIIASLIMNKPEARYRKYQELHPGIENRIPQHKLATYMGITPVSLSRIRGRKR